MGVLLCHMELVHLWYPYLEEFSRTSSEGFPEKLEAIPHVKPALAISTAVREGSGSFLSVSK